MIVERLEALTWDEKVMFFMSLSYEKPNWSSQKRTQKHFRNFRHYLLSKRCPALVWFLTWILIKIKSQHKMSDKYHFRWKSIFLFRIFIKIRNSHTSVFRPLHIYSCQRIQIEFQFHMVWPRWDKQLFHLMVSLWLWKE